MNLLSVATAYGIVTLVAEGGWAGQPVGIDTPTPVRPFIPIMMFAILFGLSMDCEVCLLSRVREAFDARRDTADAVTEGVSRTAARDHRGGGDHGRGVRARRPGWS